MRAIAAAPSAANDQANQFDQQAQDMRMQGLSAPPPQAVSPAYRTPDALGLLIGALLTSGNKNEMADFVAGFSGAKQNKAAQDTQRNQQNYQLGQAQKELQATGFERKAANARTMATGLNRGMEQAADDAESRRRFNLTLDRNLGNDKAKALAAERKLNQGDYFVMGKLSPSARRQYAIDVLGRSEAEANIYADMTPDELLKQANAALVGAKTTTEKETLKPKVEAIIAGTKNKEAGTANLESIRKRRDALAPGEVLKQERDAALAKSGIALDDARIRKINADIDNDAKKIAQSWAKINDARAKVGKQDKVTLTSQFSAYTQQLGQLRARRLELEEKKRVYTAEARLGDAKLKEYYEAAIADTNKMINDLGKIGSAVAKKQEALRVPIQKAEQQGKPLVGPLAVPGPPGAASQLPSTPGVTVEAINGKGRGGRVPATGGNANASKFELRIK
jgi:hypothetical protein